MAEELRPRWGQPITGIVSTIAFFLIAWGLWFIFSDHRGPVGAFPYPFVMYLAMMILVGLWQHMFLGDWPFQKLSPPVRGVVMTIANLIIVWFVIHVVFYRILGIGFNFLSQSNLEALAAAGKTVMPETLAKTLTYDALVNPLARFGERAVVTFVLIGFFTYPLITILFAKWPIRPSNLEQPEAGLAELGWCSLITLFFFVVLIVPFWGLIYESVFGSAFGFNKPWWGCIGGTTHVHWVFGWWEWAIVVLFMTPNVWRMKPWSLIALPQPWKGLISFVFTIALGYTLAVLCVKLFPFWQSLDEIVRYLPAGDKGNPTRFLWYHAAEIAGFTLIAFLQWHHFFDDMAPFADKDSWGAFWFRTLGVFVLMIANYVFFYHLNFGYWGLGNHHMAGGLTERYVHGESLIWNFWWIIPLLWNEWFFHKWPFYVHGGHHK
jgi:amino acid transporter, AAT family